MLKSTFFTVVVKLHTPTYYLNPSQCTHWLLSFALRVTTPSNDTVVIVLLLPVLPVMIKLWYRWLLITIPRCSATRPCSVLVFARRPLDLYLRPRVANHVVRTCLPCVCLRAREFVCVCGCVRVQLYKGSSGRAEPPRCAH